MEGSNLESKHPQHRSDEDDFSDERVILRDAGPETIAKLIAAVSVRNAKIESLKMQIGRLTTSVTEVAEQGRNAKRDLTRAIHLLGESEQDKVLLETKLHQLSRDVNPQLNFESEDILFDARGRLLNTANSRISELEEENATMEDAYNVMKMEHDSIIDNSRKEVQTLHRELERVSSQLATRAVLYSSHERRWADENRACQSQRSEVEQLLSETQARLAQMEKQYQLLDKQRVDTSMACHQFEGEVKKLKLSESSLTARLHTTTDDLNHASARIVELQNRLDSLKSSDMIRLEQEMEHEIANLREKGIQNEHKLKEELSRALQRISDENRVRAELVDEVNKTRYALSEAESELAEMKEKVTTNISGYLLGVDPVLTEVNNHFEAPAYSTPPRRSTMAIPDSDRSESSSEQKSNFRGTEIPEKFPSPQVEIDEHCKRSDADTHREDEMRPLISQEHEQFLHTSLSSVESDNDGQSTSESRDAQGIRESLLTGEFGDRNAKNSTSDPPVMRSKLDEKSLNNRLESFKSQIEIYKHREIILQAALTESKSTIGVLQERMQDYRVAEHKFQDLVILANRANSFSHNSTDLSFHEAVELVEKFISGLDQRFCDVKHEMDLHKGAATAYKDQFAAFREEIKHLETSSLESEKIGEQRAAQKFEKHIADLTRQIDSLKDEQMISDQEKANLVNSRSISVGTNTEDEVRHFGEKMEEASAIETDDKELNLLKCSIARLETLHALFVDKAHVTRQPSESEAHSDSEGQNLKENLIYKLDETTTSMVEEWTKWQDLNRGVMHTETRIDHSPGPLSRFQCDKLTRFADDCLEDIALVFEKKNISLNEFSIRLKDAQMQIRSLKKGWNTLSDISSGPSISLSDLAGLLNYIRNMKSAISSLRNHTASEMKQVLLSSSIAIRKVAVESLRTATLQEARFEKLKNEKGEVESELGRMKKPMDSMNVVAIEGLKGIQADQFRMLEARFIRETRQFKREYREHQKAKFKARLERLNSDFDNERKAILDMVKDECTSILEEAQRLFKKKREENLRRRGRAKEISQPMRTSRSGDVSHGFLVGGVHQSQSSADSNFGSLMYPEMLTPAETNALLRNVTDISSSKVYAQVRDREEFARQSLSTVSMSARSSFDVFKGVFQSKNGNQEAATKNTMSVERGSSPPVNRVSIPTTTRKTGSERIDKQSYSFTPPKRLSQAAEARKRPGGKPNPKKIRTRGR
jgi:hypothetical protein